AVGLPAWQMGNSEVGHTNLGAGRVVYQDITRIDLAIEEEDFFANETLRAAIAHVQARGSRLHTMGLFSDGGVHSHLRHLYPLLDLAKREGLDEVTVHAFTDGRDTDPKSGVTYVRDSQRRAGESEIGRAAWREGRCV